MKQKFYLILLAVLMVLPGISIKADNITVGGRQRTYIKYVPKDLGENRPLLISMHGMNQDAGYQRGMLNIESVCDTAKFVVVFPEGLNRSWDISGTQDINFVLAVIDEMVSKHKIDRNRVYLSGFSMGGMFTYHAMNHIADKIAAFAPISGYPMGGQPFTSSRPVPIIHTHGTGDDVVNFDGVQRSLDGWIARNGCAPIAYVTQHYRANIVTRHQWGPGEDGAEVVLMELADKGHWISNDNGYHTGDEIWKFCSRYSLNQKLPKVDITWPKGGAEITTIGNPDELCVHIEVNAQANEAEVSHVSIYGDDQLLTTLTQAPYVYDWNGVKNGTRMIKVCATDINGATSARGIPVSVKGTRKSLNLSTKFKADGIIPAGWVTYDGRNRLIGEVTNLTSRSRVMAFTGAERDFDYAMYVLNLSGKEDEGYAAYGDPAGYSGLNLPVGTYSLTFDACNYNMPEFGAIRCKVINVITDEVIAETEFTPTVNVGNSQSNSFTGVSKITLDFGVADTKCCKVVFYAENKKKADALVANIKLVRTSTESSITDVEYQSEAVSTTYYDIYGRQLINPANGLVIKSTTYSDGTTKSEKIIVR